MKTISKLAKWSWQDIQKLYQVYGDQLNQYKELKDRLEKGEVKINVRIDNSDSHNIFALRFLRDVRNIGRQIDVLDKEIARRNNLIGVI